MSDMDDYQEAACRTVNLDLGPDMRLATAALGLTGEAGEVADLVKKHLEQGHALDVVRVAADLGDVLWYVATLADAIEVDLSEVAAHNVAKLKARYPEGFSEERSRERDAVPRPDHHPCPICDEDVTDDDPHIECQVVVRQQDLARLRRMHDHSTIRVTVPEIASEAVKAASRPMCDNCGSQLAGRWGVGHLCADCLGAEPMRQPRCRCGHPIEVGVAHCRGCAPGTEADGEGV